MQSAGLEVTSIVDSGSSFGILASEKIRMGLPQVDPSTGGYDFERVLPADVIASASQRAQQVNRDKRGDVIAIHARRSSAR
jgi:hypothetical protein